jgi:D-glycero-D-manno-heptose 1,7-bisphosphate phosphatase
MNFKKTIVLILAGGRGLRIKRITNQIPKPLIKFNNKTILTIILNNIAKYNFKKIIILAGYKGSQIYKKYHNKYFNFNKVECLIEKRRLGTFGAIMNIKKKLTQNFIVVNGDTLFNANLENFLKFNLTKKKIVMMITKNHHYKENKKLTNLNINKKNEIQISNKKKFINSGVYLISKKILKKELGNKSSLETEIIPDLIKNKSTFGIIENKKLIDIGTYNNLLYAKKNIYNEIKKPAIFLDRDGVINYDYGYVHKYNNFKFKKHVIKALKFLSTNDIYIFIVTNQSGIARGLFQKKDFYKLHIKIKDFLLKKKIYIHDVKFSPFHVDGIIKKYRKNSGYRKPGNLMIEELFKDWNIIRKKSFMIGDSLSDRTAATKSKLYFEFAKPNLYKQVKKICKNLKIQ